MQLSQVAGAQVVAAPKDTPKVVELPYLDNEIWHKIFAGVDLEACRTNRVAYYDMLCKDLDGAWTFLLGAHSSRSSRTQRQDWSMMILLLRNGKLPVIDPLRDHICKFAALENSPVLLMEARRAGCDWGEAVSRWAIIHKSVECLKWAYENGCPLCDGCTTLAADNKSLEVLKYLHEIGRPWNGDVPAKAMLQGDLDCLRFAKEKGCPWGRKLYIMAERAYWDNRFGSSHWECLQYALVNGCPAKNACLSPLVVSKW